MIDRGPTTGDVRPNSKVIGRANYGFFDGHVEVLTPNDILNRPKYFMLNVPE